MKQFRITILLTVLMCMFGAKAFAGNEFDIAVSNSDGVIIYYNWENDKTELSVGYYYTNYGGRQYYSGNVVIPESVDYNGNTYPVTSIGYHAFYHCYGLTSVTIPNSVTYIGEAAFSDCSGLTSVTIPNNVTSIGYMAFYGCSGLSSLSIPNNVTSIGDAAFSGCSGLTSVTFPNSVQSIGSEAFRNCSDLISITISNSFTSVGSTAFHGTAWYDNQPDGLVYVGKFAYDYKGEMPENTSITITEGTLGITSGAFSDCSGLSSVTIPNSVTYIGERAFSDCSGLSSVTIPNSVTYIGERAFSGCNDLATIYSEIITPFEIGSIADNTVTLVVPADTKASYQSTAGWSSFIKTVEVGEGGLVGSRFEIDGSYYTIAENKSVSLTSVKSISGAFLIPSQVEFNGKNYSVTSIGDYAFYSCSGLSSVTIGNIIVSIGDYAFRDCISLTSVIINCNPTTIGYDIFYGCNQIEEVSFDCETVTSLFSGLSSINKITLSENIKTIGEKAFSGCSGLTSVDIPSSVTSIGNYAFSGCSGLTSVVIPNSVTSIGNYAYNNCKGLTSVIIGSGVLSIGYNAFLNTKLKKTIWLTNTPPSGYNNAEGTVNYVSNDQFGISNQVVYKYLSSHFVVDGIRYVPVSPSDRTCDAIDCTYDSSIENINIGETVTNKGVTLTVMKVNPYTCYQNKYIKDVKLSLGGDVGDYAFYECEGLVTATVNNKGSIGTSAYQSCKSLSTATINNQGGIGNKAFSGCSLLETAEIGQNVTSIDGSAFSGCSKLKNIVIPDAVNTLGSYAFHNCTAMTSVKTGNGIETIDEYTFSGCSSLNEIIIGSKVKNINQYVFSGCSALPSITIPQAVTKIGNNVFSECTSLSKVTIADSETTLTLGSNGSSPIFSSCPLDYVYIGRDISYQTSSSYGYSPFYRNTTLREVKITDKETEISENEFYGCTNLQTVTIGDGVRTIGNWAFSGCQSLNFFTFGSEVKSIGQEAFSDCSAVTEITSRANRPPTCGAQALDDINKWECKLIVPQTMMDAYKDADQWKEFFFIEEGDAPIIKTEVEISIGSSGKTTYCCDYALDFSSFEDLKAYVATGYESDGTIWLTRIKQVPANTPILVKGEASKSYEVPIIDKCVAHFENMFQGNATENLIINTTTEDGKYKNFYMSGGQFKPASASQKISAGKAYLQVPAKFKASKTGVDQTVKIAESGKSSYAPPVDVDLTDVDGLKAYASTGYDAASSTIWLTRINKIQAGEGVLLKGEAGKEYTLPSVAVQAYYGNMFVGNIGSKITINETSYDGEWTNYYLASGSFKKVSGTREISTNKSYLHLPTSLLVSSARGKQNADIDEWFMEELETEAMLLGSIGGDDDGSTRIDAIRQNNAQPDVYYNLQGQRIDNPKKGIYIHKGRKVVIRSTTK